MNKTLRWAVLPLVQTMVHRCGKGITEEQVSITGHPTRPEHATSVRKDWKGHVMESRASCGCVRFLGVYDCRIGSDLKMRVLINAKYQGL
jgi:hypothetical protein